MHSREEHSKNIPEPLSFMATALRWRGSVSPKIMPRVLVTALYATLVCIIEHFVPHLGWPITPFEYSGAVLTMILVLRVNAGHERWWEARKLWGNIVNQSRNLALIVQCYHAPQDPKVKELLAWLAAWPYVMRESLRNTKKLEEVTSFIGITATQALIRAEHMPMYVGWKVTNLIHNMRIHGMDPFIFHLAEQEKTKLIDAIGACERIRNTPMPFVLAIKTRRFLVMFLALLPLALEERVGWLTPFVVMLAAYPLFSLDEIGAELQNPFDLSHVSHLPLSDICKTIAQNVLSLPEIQHTLPFRPPTSLQRSLPFSTPHRWMTKTLRPGVLLKPELGKKPLTIRKINRFNSDTLMSPF